MHQLHLRHALVLQCLPEKIRELKSCMELASYAKLGPSHSLKLEGLEDLRVGSWQSLPLCFQKREKLKALAVCAGSFPIWIMIKCDKGGKQNFLLHVSGDAMKKPWRRDCHPGRKLVLLSCLLFFQPCGNSAPRSTLRRSINTPTGSACLLRKSYYFLISH